MACRKAVRLTPRAGQYRRRPPETLSRLIDSCDVLVVNKWLETRAAGGRVDVRTEEYAYHALMFRPAPRADLFRYDNCHGGLATLHCHRWDALGVEVAPAPIAHAALPTLDLIVREADARAEALALARANL